MQKRGAHKENMYSPEEILRIKKQFVENEMAKRNIPQEITKNSNLK